MAMKDLLVFVKKELQDIIDELELNDNAIPVEYNMGCDGEKLISEIGISWQTPAGMGENSISIEKNFDPEKETMSIIKSIKPVSLLDKIEYCYDITIKYDNEINDLFKKIWKLLGEQK